MQRCATCLVVHSMFNLGTHFRMEKPSNISALPLQ